MPCKEKHFQHSNIFKQVLPVTTKLTRYTHNKPRPIPSQQNSHHTHHRHSLDGVTSSLLNITHPAGSCHVWSEHHYNLGRSTRTTFYPLTALVCLHSLLHSYLCNLGCSTRTTFYPLTALVCLHSLLHSYLCNLGCSTRTTFYRLTALVCLHSLLHSYLCNLGCRTRTTFYPLTALVCLHSLLHSYLWKQAIWYKVVCHGRFRSSKLVPIESQYAISYLSSIIIRNLGCFPCI